MMKPPIPLSSIEYKSRSLPVLALFSLVATACGTSTSSGDAPAEPGAGTAGALGVGGTGGSTVAAGGAPQGTAGGGHSGADSSSAGSTVGGATSAGGASGSSSSEAGRNSGGGGSAAHGGTAGSAAGGTAGKSGGGAGGAIATAGSSGSTSVTDPSASCPGGVPAFPGAQGPAGCATGGRNGDVYHVTNLSDSGTAPAEGSLRYGILKAPAAGRTIVFDVAGTIVLNPPGRVGWLTVGSNNITIAGQTAPWPGITVMGAATKVAGQNIIIRHMHFRPGQDRANPGISTNDAMWIEGQNVIVDHLSNSWADDELLSITDAAEKVTVQYCLLEEGLEYALVAGMEQGKGHSMGGIIGSDVSGTPLALYHNIYAHSGTRNPRYGSEVGTGSVNDFAENLIYNWMGACGYAGSGQVYSGNLRNNYYLAGKSTTTSDKFFSAAGTEGKLYTAGNVLDSNKNGTFDGPQVGPEAVAGKYTAVSTPFDLLKLPLDSAAAARDKALASAGAFYWKRDVVDARIINEIKTGTGEIALMPKTSEWNALWNATTPVKRASGFDSDNDGMPDTWESAHGLNPSDAGDAKKLSGGYTNLEAYLNAAAEGKGYP